MSDPGARRRANAAYVRKDPSRWKNAGWTSVPNSIIRDPDIPMDETWAWIWLASHDGEFEVSGALLWQAKKDLGRNKAYDLLKALEKRGLLLRTNEYDPVARVPYIQYDLQPVPVPENERTWEPSKAAPRRRGPHPGSKAARAATSTATEAVDNSEQAGQPGFPAGRESAGSGRTPDREGIRSDQGVPDRPGSGVDSRQAGFRQGGNPYIEEKISREENLSIEEGSMDQPDDQEPSPQAVDLVLGLVFGGHARPTERQARELARLVDAARSAGHTWRSIRQHAQAKVNQATKNPVTYLIRGLEPDNLPAVRSVPAAPVRPPRGQSDGNPGHLSAAPDSALLHAGGFLPSRLRAAAVAE